MSNKIKLNKNKKEKKSKLDVPKDAGQDKYFERNKYKTPDLKPNKNYRGKV